MGRILSECTVNRLSKYGYFFWVLVRFTQFGQLVKILGSIFRARLPFELKQSEFWFRFWDLTEDSGFSISSICWMSMFVSIHSTQGGAWEHFLIRHMDWKKIFQYFMEIISIQTRTLHWHISITLIWMISLLILLLNLLFWE